MAKVKLLKDLGDHKAGEELEVKDKTVLEAWERLGVIAKPKATAKEAPEKQA